MTELIDNNSVEIIMKNSEVLLVAILQYYVKIMNELDITNYLTPRYLTELIDDKDYYDNLRIYSKRYDWDLEMALETIYLEIGLRQCGLPPEIISKIICLQSD